MQFDFSRFLLEIEHRFRRFRALSLACRFLFYGSIACVVSILGLRWLTPDLDRGLTLLTLLIPFILSIAAFILGWRECPNLPHLLLLLDDELESGARISSLYEARVRGQVSFFRNRLEKLVESISTDWKRGITLQRRTFGFLSAGTVGVLIACIILAIPFSFPRAVSLESLGQREISGTQLPRPSSTETSQDDTSTMPDEAAAPLELSEDVTTSQTDSAQELPQTRSNEELSLDSIFDDLSDLSRGQAQVDVPTTSDELLALSEAQEQARQALSEMLQDLQQQMKDNPRPLTQQESRDLQELASQTGDSEIEEKTDDLVDEPNPDQIGEKLQDLLEEVDPDAVDPETSPETSEENADGSGQDSPQSTEVSGDEEAGQRFLESIAERLEEQANAETEQDEGHQQPANPQDEDDTQEPVQDSSTGIRLSGEPDDLSQVGGEDGLGGTPGEDPQPGEVGFIREEAPSIVGEEGEFIDEFVTKGVPVEIVSSQDRTDTHFVDFERMDSILQERDLPDEALTSVRRYFELITQPEGGS